MDLPTCDPESTNKKEIATTDKGLEQSRSHGRNSLGK